VRARAKIPLHEVSDKQRSRHVRERGAGIVKLAGGEAGVVDLLFEFLILKSNQKTLRALVQKLRKDDALPIGIFPTEVAPTVMAVDVAVAMIGHLRLSDERYARLRDYMKRGEWGKTLAQLMVVATGGLGSITPCVPESHRMVKDRNRKSCARARRRAPWARQWGCLRARPGGD